jgi:hypothetical protein
LILESSGSINLMGWVSANSAVTITPQYISREGNRIRPQGYLYGWSDHGVEVGHHINPISDNVFARRFMNFHNGSLMWETGHFRLIHYLNWTGIAAFHHCFEIQAPQIWWWSFAFLFFVPDLVRSMRSIWRRRTASANRPGFPLFHWRWRAM